MNLKFFQGIIIIAFYSTFSTIEKPYIRAISEAQPIFGPGIMISFNEYAFLISGNFYQKSDDL